MCGMFTADQGQLTSLFMLRVKPVRSSTEQTQPAPFQLMFLALGACWNWQEMHGARHSYFSAVGRSMDESRIHRYPCRKHSSERSIHFCSDHATQRESVRVRHFALAGILSTEYPPRSFGLRTHTALVWIWTTGECSRISWQTWLHGVTLS